MTLILFLNLMYLNMYFKVGVTVQVVGLFGKTKQNVSLHIRNIFKEGELLEDAVVKDSLTTAFDGKRKNITFLM